MTEVPKTKKIIAFTDMKYNGIDYPENSIIDFPIDEEPPKGFREAYWQDFVNEKSAGKEKKFIHFSTMSRLGLLVCTPPSQYRVLKNFTFYRIVANVDNKSKGQALGEFTFYLTDYDAREEKGGYQDGIIPDDCWCLFTFNQGRRAIQFFTRKTIDEILPETMNALLQKMFDSLQ